MGDKEDSMMKRKGEGFEKGKSRRKVGGSSHKKRKKGGRRDIL